MNLSLFAVVFFTVVFFHSNIFHSSLLLDFASRRRQLFSRRDEIVLKTSYFIIRFPGGKDSNFITGTPFLLVIKLRSIVKLAFQKPWTKLFPLHGGTESTVGALNIYLTSTEKTKLSVITGIPQKMLSLWDF